MIGHVTYSLPMEIFKNVLERKQIKIESYIMEEYYAIIINTTYKSGD